MGVGNSDDSVERYLPSQPEEPDAPSPGRTRLRESEPWERGVAQIEAEDGLVCPVMHPDHPFRTKWDTVQVLALCYVAIIVPVRTGFGIELEPGSAEWGVELFFDLYFIIDIFINFRTGFIDENGVIEMRPAKIARSYARSWLAIDVVSCLPIPYIMQILKAMDHVDHGGSSNVKLFKILRLLRLAKLLRLGRLKKIIKRHEEEIEGLMGMVKVLGVAFSMSYICHLLACGWYFVGTDVEVDGLIPQRGWIYNQMEGVWNATGDRPEIDFGTKYITCYYWAITTISTVGYGDITGQTNSERLYSVFAEMVGCLLFAMLTGALGSMMVGQKLLEEKVDKQLGELREFMQSKGIPKDLRIKIRRYMETLYQHKTGFDEQEVLNQLPPAMAQELIQHMYKSIFSNVHMFKNLEENAITKLCSLIKPYTAMRGDIIYRRGEAGREVYIILDGHIQVTYNDLSSEGATETIQKTVGPGDTFGEGCCAALFEVLDDDDQQQVYTRVSSATAVDDCEMRFLTLDNLKEVCALYPSVRTQLWLLVQGFEREQSSAEIAHWNAQSDTNVTTSTVSIAKKLSEKLRGQHSPIQGMPTAQSNTDSSNIPPARNGSNRSMRSLPGLDSEGEQTQQLDASMAKLEGRVIRLEAMCEKRFDEMMQAIARLEPQPPAPQVAHQLPLPNIVEDS